MRKEPEQKRAMVFIDGQNLYYAARLAFGHTSPNYDPYKLGRLVCRQNGWRCGATERSPGIHFFTGIPDKAHDPHWNEFWDRKLTRYGRHKNRLRVITRPVRYIDQPVKLPNGREGTVQIGQEKGIDVRIALDVVRYAIDEEFDVAVIFSQDQDLAELADEIRLISERQDRWIKVVSAFPVGSGTTNSRGINGTDWVRIDRETYDACLDPDDQPYQAA